MYIVINKQSKVLSKDGAWTYLYDIDNVRIFTTYLSASQTKEKVCGFEICSTSALFASLIMKLSPSGKALHDAVMLGTSIDCVKVGGFLENKELINKLNSEVESLKRELEACREELEQNK